LKTSDTHSWMNLGAISSTTNNNHSCNIYTSQIASPWPWRTHKTVVLLHSLQPVVQEARKSEQPSPRSSRVLRGREKRESEEPASCRAHQRTTIDGWMNDKWSANSFLLSFSSLPS
jgi:hypothetical protein